MKMHYANRKIIENEKWAKMRISRSRFTTQEWLRPMREEVTSKWITFVKQLFFVNFADA